MQGVLDFRKAAALFPFDHRYRIGSSLFLGNVAVQVDNDQVKEIAVGEMKHALITDPTSADILGLLVACELVLHKDADAQMHYDQFKRVAKMSPLMDMIKQAKQEHLKP
jgi:hypothetical protein